MRNCPKCHVDFSDDFAFCEFDGNPLDTVFEEKRGFALWSTLFAQRKVVQMVGIAFLIGIIALFIMANNRRQPKPMAVNQNPSAAVETASFFVETPQAARDFSEEPADEKTQKEAPPLPNPVSRSICRIQGKARGHRLPQKQSRLKRPFLQSPTPSRFSVLFEISRPPGSPSKRRSRPLAQRQTIVHPDLRLLPTASLRRKQGREQAPVPTPLW